MPAEAKDYTNKIMYMGVIPHLRDKFSSLIKQIL
jgi:hypothetical protein